MQDGYPNATVTPKDKELFMYCITAPKRSITGLKKGCEDFSNACRGLRG